MYFKPISNKVILLLLLFSLTFYLIPRISPPADKPTLYGNLIDRVYQEINFISHSLMNGDAWSGIKEEKEMIIRSFVKCGLSNKLDGSEDHMVNIRGIEGYVMPKPVSEFHLESDSDSSESEYDERSCDDASLSSSD